MNDTVTYAALNRLLARFGFVSHRVPGSHVRWERPHSDTELLLPDKDETQPVWVNKLMAVRSVLDREGVLSAEDFDRWRLGPNESAPDNDTAVPPKRSRRPPAPHPARKDE